MSDDIKRLQLSIRLHEPAVTVLEHLLTADGPPSLQQMHTMCSVAERVERAGDFMGPNDELFLSMLQQLMKATEEVREYVDARRER